MEWSIVAVTLLIVGCLAAGVSGAVVRTWSLHSRTYSLEDRVAILEGTLQREVKTRAGQERWKKPDRLETQAAELVRAAVAQAPPVSWWHRPDLPRSANDK